MNFDRPDVKQGDSSGDPINREKIFEEIKTPEELVSFLRGNIRYGFIGKKDRKIYSPEFEGWGQGEQPEHELQSPDDLLNSGYGTCWEQTELEKKWFREHSFEFKTFLFMFGPEINQKHPAHTFLAFRKDGKWYWLENTLDGHNGIHEFDSLEALSKKVQEVVIANAIRNGATEDDIKQGRLMEYDIPAHGLSPQEFVSQVVAGKNKVN